MDLEALNQGCPEGLSRVGDFSFQDTTGPCTKHDTVLIVLWALGVFMSFLASIFAVYIYLTKNGLQRQKNLCSFDRNVYPSWFLIVGFLFSGGSGVNGVFHLYGLTVPGQRQASVVGVGPWTTIMWSVVGIMFWINVFIFFLIFLKLAQSMVSKGSRSSEALVMAKKWSRLKVGASMFVVLMLLSYLCPILCLVDPANLRMYRRGHILFLGSIEFIMGFFLTPLVMDDLIENLRDSLDNNAQLKGKDAMAQMYHRCVFVRRELRNQGISQPIVNLCFAFIPQLEENLAYCLSFTNLSSSIVLLIAMVVFSNLKIKSTGSSISPSSPLSGIKRQTSFDNSVTSSSAGLKGSQTTKIENSLNN